MHFLAQWAICHLYFDDEAILLNTKSFFISIYNPLYKNGLPLKIFAHHKKTAFVAFDRLLGLEIF